MSARENPHALCSSRIVVKKGALLFHIDSARVIIKDNGFRKIVRISTHAYTHALTHTCTRAFTIAQKHTRPHTEANTHTLQMNTSTQPTHLLHKCITSNTHLSDLLPLKANSFSQTSLPARLAAPTVAKEASLPFRDFWMCYHVLGSKSLANTKGKCDRATADGADLRLANAWESLWQNYIKVSVK